MSDQASLRKLQQALNRRHQAYTAILRGRAAREIYGHISQAGSPAEQALWREEIAEFLNAQLGREARAHRRLLASDLEICKILSEKN